ncbi:(2Fe-2S) ferredoxin domain-containing protein [Gordoniibacillus kamchatkensis]|uniref:(2Fe-2S) ferredoxin domain-containing protein n=1 Tax=Gordoniibacillus kamchatkensis TaxID=1590651 RepID=UPI00069722CD|nr:(2Fe-2S) ferredoxin domain-containing protein [Paenibacillus sp. VKM B-2647]
MTVTGGAVTKRAVLAQVLICSGCCCGKTEKGKPPVPVDWLKARWKELGLKKRVQLTISGCLGPCDLVNVVCVMTQQGPVWLGGLTDFDHYAAIADWASAVMERGALLPLPEELMRFAFERFDVGAGAGLYTALPIN